MEHKHICIISPSLKIGGIERALTVLANYFTGKGIKVTFISCLSGHHFYELHENITLIEPDFKRSSGIYNAMTFYPRLIRFVRNKVKKINPDTVLAFGDWFSPLVLLALIGTKFPVYISDRTSPDYQFKFPVPFLKKWLYPKSAGFIAQTKRAADYKQKKFRDTLNIKIISNAIREVKHYPEIPREKVILYLGRFAWEKGPERLVQAFSKIENREGWRLVMAGTGPLLDGMKQLTQSLKIESEVHFPGEVNDVDNLFATSSIYALPSVLEGFPNALCEAMAAGLPVLCFDSIPYEEILTNNIDGLVIKEGDVDALARKLQYLINNESERERLGGSAMKIKERLNVDKIGSRIFQFISGH